MEALALNKTELAKVEELLNGKRITNFSIRKYFSAMGCDKYDCWVRGAQCPCEGICDGRA